LHSTTIQKKLLGESRFAGIRVGDDRKGAPAGNFLVHKSKMFGANHRSIVAGSTAGRKEN
jgi:hypothetical protein